MQLLVRRRIVHLGELNSVFAAASQPALIAWRVEVSARVDGSRPVPIQLIFQESAFRISDEISKGVWYPRDRDVSNVTFSGITSAATRLSLQCTLREGHHVHLMEHQKQALECTSSRVPLDVISRAVGAYIARQPDGGDEHTAFDRIVLEPSKPLTFVMDEATAMTRNDSMEWTFEVPLGELTTRLLHLIKKS